MCNPYQRLLDPSLSFKKEAAFAHSPPQITRKKLLERSGRRGDDRESGCRIECRVGVDLRHLCIIKRPGTPRQQTLWAYNRARDISNNQHVLPKFLLAFLDFFAAVVEASVGFGRLALGNVKQLVVE